MSEPLSERARGRWRDILPALGVPLAFLNGKHQACPICGGKDRARFDDKEGRGTFFCNAGCTDHGIGLVMKLRGVDFKGAAQLIEPLIGGAAPRHAPRPEPSEEDKRARMNELWGGAQPITRSDAAGLWLDKRVGLSAFPPALRFHDRVAIPGGGRTRMPAMLAKVTDRGGLPVQLHRTFLTPEGDKAPIAVQRAIMPGHLPEGAAVWLAPVGEVLGIAEGIETALAASILHDMLPCWAALNEGRLRTWSPPAGVRHVIVFGDNDSTFVGQGAAYDLARRLVSEARRKGDDRFAVDVTIPPVIGEDWNDVLLREMARQEAQSDTPYAR